MTDDPLIPIDCAVNDDYGSTTTRVQSIHVPGLELEADPLAGVHFRELPHRHGEFRIRVSRREWGVRHLASGVGNIYWERYGMRGWVAAAFLHYLRAGKLFQPDSGHEELWQWWDSGIRDEAHVRRLLIDAAKDDRL